MPRAYLRSQDNATRHRRLRLTPAREREKHCPLPCPVRLPVPWPGSQCDSWCARAKSACQSGSPRSPSTYNGSLFFFRVGDSLRAFYDDGTASHDCPSEPLIIHAPVRFRHRESRLLFGFEIPIQDGRVAEQVHIFELFEVLPVLAILERSIWGPPFPGTEHNR